MEALGLTCRQRCFHALTDIEAQQRNVRFVPKADIRLLRPISDELIYVNAVGRSLTRSVVALEAD